MNVFPKAFGLFFLICFSALALRAEAKVIHVLVALCDNEYQGIVKVPPKIGNGKDFNNNLYWGCGYGIRTFFKKQPEWKLLKTVSKPKTGILERIVFKHVSKEVFLVADAYDGELIKQTTIDLLNFSAGLNKETIAVDSLKIGIGGNADLICYIGHNGLMDFALESYPVASDKKKRETIILACYSKSWFTAPLAQTGAYPLLWSTHLMAPEAYTLHAAIEGWLNREEHAQIRERAAQAYDKYQKCGIKGARNLLVTGW
jgi:hypothetical protein